MAAILLDSHVWLWMNSAPRRLADSAADLLADGNTLLFLSAASVWEIAIKASIGKLEVPESNVERYVTKRLEQNRVEVIPISHLHGLRAAALPAHHRDPFDRMLVAQAQLERLPLMTADPFIPLYALETIPAA